jgi:hypothetical protein
MVVAERDSTVCAVVAAVSRVLYDSLEAAIPNATAIKGMANQSPLLPALLVELTVCGGRGGSPGWLGGVITTVGVGVVIGGGGCGGGRCGVTAMAWASAASH